MYVYKKMNKLIILLSFLLVILTMDWYFVMMLFDQNNHIILCS